MYHNCSEVLACTALRALMNRPVYRRTMADDYIDFMNKHYLPKIFEHLIKFRYCIRAWYSSLTADKQKEVKIYMLGTPVDSKPPPFKSMNKTEAQNKYDKIRQIGIPSNMHKYVLGPIVKPLQKTLSEALGEGWSVGKSYEDKEKIINELQKTYGYDTTITIDISGLDQSHNGIVRYGTLQILQFLINNGLITHIDANIFKEYCMRDTSKICYSKTEKETNTPLFIMELWQKLPSGDGLTTTINTVMIDSIHKFIKHINKNQTHNLTAGDDSVQLLHSYDLNATLKIYKQVFTAKNVKDLPWGLGLILKYLRVGKLVDSTPCSTELYKCKCGYKMVRMLDRFMRYTIVSTKCLSYSDQQLKGYNYAVAEGILKWGKGLDIFQDLADYYFRIGDKECLKYVIQGEKREKLGDLDEDMVAIYSKNELKIDQINNIFGKNTHYSILERDSEKCVYCPESWRERMITKYKITPGLLIQIKELINTADVNKPIDTTLLEIAFSEANEYIEKLNVEPELNREEILKITLTEMQDLPFNFLETKNIGYWEPVKRLFLVLTYLPIQDDYYYNRVSDIHHFKTIYKKLLEIGILENIPTKDEIGKLNTINKLQLINYDKIKNKWFDYEIMHDLKKQLEENDELLMSEDMWQKYYKRADENIIAKTTFENNLSDNDLHEHECNYCDRVYAHWHNHKKIDHPQHKYQCPYNDCESFMGLGDAKITHSVMLNKRYNDYDDDEEYGEVDYNNLDKDELGYDEALDDDLDDKFNG
jgi:hypothetical protein